MFIIAGCNGSGKTTASFTILPEIIECREFVNADEIARGMSPFQPEKVAIQAGKIMLNRINELISNGVDFAFETTLSTQSYLRTIEFARRNNYKIYLLFLWLESVDLAIERVFLRVKNGGHYIHESIIRRRYERGLQAFFMKFRYAVDNWLFVDNSKNPFVLIAEGGQHEIEIHHRNDLWQLLNKQYS